MSLDKVVITVNDEEIKYIKSYSIRKDLFTGAGELRVELDSKYFINLVKEPALFKVKINGSPVMVGYLDRLEESYSKGNKSQTVVGRDMCQVLIDNYILETKNYGPDPADPTSLGYSLRSIVADLLDNFVVTTVMGLDLNNEMRILGIV